MSVNGNDELLCDFRLKCDVDENSRPYSELITTASKANKVFPD